MNASASRVRPIRLRRLLAWVAAVILVQAVALQPARAYEEPAPPPDATLTDQTPPADVPPDTPADVPPDMPADVPPDTPADVPPDMPADVPPDTPADVPPDTPADVPPDTPATDQLVEQAVSTTQLIVKFKAPGIAQMQSLGIEGANTIKSSATGAQLMTVPAADLPATLATLRENPQVEYVEPNYQLHALVIDPNWALTEVNAGNAWTSAHNILGQTYQVPPITVAVVDSGVNAHADLAGRIGASVTQITGALPDAVADDTPEGHGTHVAGIIAAVADNGIGIDGVMGPFPVSIQSVKVLDQAGVGTVFDVAQGIYWAADNGARVINLSLGAYLPDFPHALADAVVHAQNRGALVVAAAGNDSRYDLTNFYPACLPGVLSVAATGPDHAIAAFSNQGALLNAPGVDILSTGPGAQDYSALSGTSFAAPIASGAAALLMLAQPAKSAGEVSSALQSSQDFSSSGARVLDMDAALSILSEGSVPIDSLDIIQPATDSHVAGLVTITAQLRNPAAVTKVEFYADPPDTQNALPMATVPGPLPKSGQVTADWLTSQVANGPYVVRVIAYRDGKPALDVVAPVVVANNPVSGLALTVVEPDCPVDGCLPAVGAQVRIMRPMTFEYPDGRYYVLEPVGDGTYLADQNGRVILPNTVAQDGGDYLVVATGTDPDFLYWQVVRTPIDVTLEPADAVHLTLSATDVGGAPLGGAHVMSQLFAGMLGEPFSTAVAAAIESVLPASGSHDLYVMPGLFDFRLEAADHTYHLTQTDVNVTADATIAFQPSAETVAAVRAQPDPAQAFADYGLALAEHNAYQSGPQQPMAAVDKFVPQDTVVRLSPGEYDPVFRADIADPAYKGGPPATLHFTLKGPTITPAAGDELALLFGGGPVTATLAPAQGQADPIPLGQPACFAARFADTYDNGFAEAQAHDSLGSPLGDLKPELAVTGPAMAGGSFYAYQDYGNTGTWEVCWFVPEGQQVGAYQAAARFYLGPLAGTEDGWVATAPVAFSIGSAPPKPSGQIELTVLDRTGAPLPGAEVSVQQQYDQAYYSVYDYTTDGNGQFFVTPWYYGRPDSAAMLAIRGCSPVPDRPNDPCEDVYVQVPIPTDPYPIVMTVDLSAFDFQPIDLQTTGPTGAGVTAAAYGVFGSDQTGAMAGLPDVNPRAVAAGQSVAPPYRLWVVPGDYVFTATATDGQGNLIRDISAVTTVAEPGASIALGGTALSGPVTVTPPADTDYYLGAVVMFDRDWPAISSPNLINPAGGIYVTAGDYAVDFALVRRHYDGEWDYWLEAENVTAGEGAALTLAVDSLFTANLQLSGTSFAPDDELDSFHIFSDGEGNRLTAVAQNLHLWANSAGLARAWRVGAGGMLLSLRTKGLVVSQHQWSAQLAPYFTITAPDGTEVYRYADPGQGLSALSNWDWAGASLYPVAAGGTFYGDAVTIPADAASGMYTATLELSVGPQPPITAQPVTFAVNGLGAPVLNPLPAVTNAQAVTISGTAPAGTTVTITYTVGANPPVTAGATTADATGAFSLAVSLPTEGSYSFTVSAASGGTTSQAHASLLVDRTPPGPPEHLSAAILSEDEIALTWTKPADTDIAEYQVTRDSGTPESVPAQGTLRYTDGDLTTGVAYTYTVVAVDRAGNVSVPATITVTPTPAPSISASYEEGAVYLEWTKITGSTGYRIYRAMGADAPLLLTEVGGDVGTWTDTDLVAETTYTYTYTVLDAQGAESAPSAPAQVTTPPIQISQAGWWADRNRSQRLLLGCPLTLTLEGDPGYTGTFTLGYDTWFDAQNNLLQAPVAATETVNLTEDSQDPGVYTGTFLLREGIAAITAVSGRLADAFGHHADVQLTGGLPVEVAGAVHVTFVGANVSTMMSVLDGGRVIAYNERTHSGMTAELAADAAEYALDGLNPAPDYSVRVTDEQGRQVTVVDHLVAVERGLTTSLEISMVLPATLKVAVEKPGVLHAVGIAVRVENSAGQTVAKAVTGFLGSTYAMTGFHEGDAVTVVVEPGEASLAAARVPVTLVAGENEVEVTLAELERGTANGTVRLAGAAPIPLAGQVVTARQTLGGRTFTAVSQPTGPDGRYSVEIYIGVPAELTAGNSWDRYAMVGAPPVVTIASGETVTRDIDMEAVGSTIVTADIYTKYLGADEQGPIQMNWRNAVHFGLNVRGPQGYSWGWQYPVEVQARTGDHLTVCISGREAQLPDACQDVVVGADHRANAVFHLVQPAGSVQASIADPNGQPLTNWTALLLQQAAGGGCTAVRQATGSSASLDLQLPGPGTYQLYVESPPYSRLETFITDGTTYNFGVLQLQAAGFFRSHDGNGVSVTPAEVAPGGAVTFRAAYKYSGVAPLTGGSLHLTIPAGTTLDLTSIIHNGALYDPGATVSATGFDVSLGAINAGDSGWVTWRVTLDQAFSSPAVAAAATITWDGAGTGERLGTASARVLQLDMAVPATVPTPTLHASGRAPLNSTVSIYAGSIQLGSAATSPAGLWSAAVPLPVTTGVPDWVTLRAEARDAGGALLADITRLVRYDPDEPYLKLATMSGDYYGEPTRSVTVDPSAGVARFPYVYIPGQQMLFNLEFTHPERIYDVHVGIDSVAQAPALPGADQHFTAGMGSGWQMGPVWVSYKVKPAPYPNVVIAPALSALKLQLGDLWLSATVGSFTGGALPINLGGDAASQVTVTYTVQPAAGFAPGSADAAKVAAGGAPVYNLQVVTNPDGSIDLSAVVPAQGGGYVRVTIHIAGAAGLQALLQSVHSSILYTEGMDELDKLVEDATACQLASSYSDKISALSTRLESFVLLQHALQFAGAYLADPTGGNTTAVSGLPVWNSAHAISFRLASEWRADLEALKHALLEDQGCRVTYFDHMIIMVPVWIMDPSGYVYEAVPENRLTDVTVTLMQGTVQPDNSVTWTVWDGAWYGQANPLATDVKGAYGWDVPAGKWQVTYQKDGYQPEQSPVLDVPPPRTDVNQAMVSLLPPDVVSVALTQDGAAIDVTFTKYMQAPDLTADAIQVQNGTGTLVAGSVTPVAPVAGSGGVQLFRTARFTPAAPLTGGDTYSVSVGRLIRSYAGVTMARDISASVIAGSDMTPPADLVANTVSVTPGDGRLSVSWTSRPADAAKLRLYWGIGGYGAQADVTLTPGVNTGSTSISGLTNGISYSLKLTAIDAAGNESAGLLLTGKPVDTTAPAPVAGARVDSAGPELAVVWVDPADPDFTKVLVSWTAGGSTGAAEVAAGLKTAALTGLTSASTVTVTLISVDAAGNHSAPVTLVYPTPVTPPSGNPVIAPVSGVAVQPGDGKLTVTWVDPTTVTLAKLLVIWDGGSMQVAKGAQSYTITGLTNGRLYQISVTAIDSAGVSAAPVTVSGTPKDQVAPGAVTGLTAAAGDGRATIRWTDPGDKDIAKLLVAWEGGSAEAAPGAGTFTITGLANGTAYHVTVTVQDTSGNQSAAAAVTVTPAGTQPPVHPPVEPPVQPGTVLQVDIGTTGIDAHAEDGSVRLIVPAGAFPAGTHLTVRLLEHPAVAGLATFGPTVELDASGVQPTAPVVLMLHYNSSDLGTLDVRKLGIYRQDESNPTHWIYVGGAIDAASGTVRTSLTHLSSYAVMAYDKRFADLTNHWSRADVEVLVSRQVVNGTSATTFEPDRAITRAEMAKLLVTMLQTAPGSQVNLTPPAAPTFSDVAPAAWYYAYVEAAARLGIVRGDGGKFRPNDTITREELAAMIVRALGLEQAAMQAGTDLPFADAAAISGWARGYVAVAAQKGLVHGMTETTFEGRESATRAQAAVIVLRAMTWQGQVIAK